MNRRDFLKTIPLAVSLTSALPVKANENLIDDSKHTYYNYYVNCYTQNQKYWPLEAYKDGSFKNGKLYFASFQGAVDFIHTHSLVTPFYNEALYEVFHETSRDPMIAPKQIFTYWIKLKEGDEPETITWIRPDYIDYTADGALIEHVK
jgi:hypothetical protein